MKTSVLNQEDTALQWKPADTWVSWNGNVRHAYRGKVVVHSEEDISRAIASSRSVRMTGNGQSSADIVAGTDVLLDPSEYTGILEFDRGEGTITVQSGIRLKELMQALEREGWTLPCLPDIDTVTLGGAISTGTHGTTGGAHPIAESMIRCTLVQADGSVLTVHEGDENMPAIRCGLGVLGVLSTITLQCVPLYWLRVTEEAVPDAVWTKEYQAWLRDYAFVRVIWLPHTGYAWVVRGQRIDEDTPVDEQQAPARIAKRREVSKALYARTIRFPRFTRLANRILKRLFFSHSTVVKGTLYGATVTKSRGSTLELGEWTVDRGRFDELFSELQALLDSRDNDAYAHIPMDIRFLDADETWLSNAYGRPTVTVGCVTRNAEHADSYQAFALVEELFLRYGGRPHWAKRFDAKAAELRSLYPRWDDFLTLRERMDPEGTFLTPYLRSLLGV